MQMSSIAGWMALVPARKLQSADGRFPTPAHSERSASELTASAAAIGLTIVQLIGATTHTGGLTVRCADDRNWYPTGERISDTAHPFGMTSAQGSGGSFGHHAATSRSESAVASPRARLPNANRAPRAQVAGHGNPTPSPTNSAGAPQTVGWKTPAEALATLLDAMAV